MNELHENGTITVIKPEEFLSPPNPDQATIASDPNKFIDGVVAGAKLESEYQKTVQATKNRAKRQLQNNIGRLINRIKNGPPEKQMVKRLIHHLESVPDSK